VYLVDADFRIREVNPVALPVFGDIPHLEGRDFDEVVHLLWERPFADEIVAIFRHTLETGEPYVAPERGERRLDRDGIEYYEWELHRIPRADGRFGVVCYFRDVSARITARNRLAGWPGWPTPATAGSSIAAGGGSRPSIPTTARPSPQPGASPVARWARSRRASACGMRGVPSIATS
jgi:PAS domain S-box-containing protein